MLLPNKPRKRCVMSFCFLFLFFVFQIVASVQNPTFLVLQQEIAVAAQVKKHCSSRDQHLPFRLHSFPGTLQLVRANACDIVR